MREFHALLFWSVCRLRQQSSTSTPRLNRRRLVHTCLDLLKSIWNSFDLFLMIFKKYIFSNWILKWFVPRHFVVRLDDVTAARACWLTYVWCVFLFFIFREFALRACRNRQSARVSHEAPFRWINPSGSPAAGTSWTRTVCLSCDCDCAISSFLLFFYLFLCLSLFPFLDLLQCFVCLPELQLTIGRNRNETDLTSTHRSEWRKM